MKMKNKILSILLAVGLTAVSCTDILDTKPQAALTEDQVLKDVATTQSILNGALASLRNGGYYGRDMILLPELLADNCSLVNPGDRSGRGLNQSINLSGSHLNIYFAYQGMNSANLVIDAIDKSQVVITSQADAVSINRLKAQALFIRALIHFDMVRTYSYNPNYILNNWDKGVPIVIAPVKSKADISLPSRSTILAVYQQVEKDLLDAINLFTLTGTPNPASKFLPNRAAAQALLARVYLYWAGPTYPEKYQLAVNMATEAINSGVAVLSNNITLASNWASAASPESYFEVNFASNQENLGGDNSLQGWYTRQVNATTGARITGWGDVIASNSLLAQFAAGDLRGSIAATGLLNVARRDFEPASSRETRKYNAPSGGQFGLKNVPILRIPEMYLIRAEANSYLNNDVAALADLNLVRFGTVGRTGLSAAPGSLTGAALRDEIYAERRRELAFEGHRWFDFTRRGLDVLKPDGTIIAKTDFRILANIPLSEVQANKNLEQNPGY
jgi:hypothetical protein